MSDSHSNSQPLADHLAFITGGGSGIGLACASALLADGAGSSLRRATPID